MAEYWPEQWTVEVSEECSLHLPLITSDDGFSIYALDLMGQTGWNKVAAKGLYDRLTCTGFEFDIILTAEAKAIALAEELASCFSHNRYVVLRKSPKLYMKKPIVVVDVQSITTKAPQHFYLGSDSAALLQGKKVCVLDDVISTGGTLHAIFNVAQKVGFTVTVVAAVLTEQVERQSFNGVPIVALGHIPLPGMSERM